MPERQRSSAFVRSTSAASARSLKIFIVGAALITVSITRSSSAHLIGELTRASMFPLENRRVADIGCGTGRWLLEFAQWDASDLHGIDLDESRIGLAKERFPSADLHAGDARHMPWADNYFDIVSQFTLFTSMDRSVPRIAREMLRVVKPDGLILWFDFRVNNPRNRNVRDPSRPNPFSFPELRYSIAERDPCSTARARGCSHLLIAACLSGSIGLTISEIIHKRCE